MYSIAPDRIRALRKTLGLNRTKFAEIMGYSIGQQSQIETGNRGLNYQCGLILRLLEREGVEAVEALMTDDAPPTPHFVAALPVRPDALDYDGA